MEGLVIDDYFALAVSEQGKASLPTRMWNASRLPRRPMTIRVCGGPPLRTSLDNLAPKLLELR